MPPIPSRLALTGILLAAAGLPSGLAAAETSSFDTGWRFARFGLQADGTTRPEPADLEKPAAADTAWRKLDLPHDWAIEGPFRLDLEGATGKLPWKGIGWYRKTFTLPASDAGNRVFLDFDGAMANARVWCNGKLAGERPFGYSSFRVDLTPHLLPGADNVVAVRLDTEKWGSRWYPGAGIYRHTRLVKAAPVHVGQWGVYVTTPEITDAAGVAKLAVTVDNAGAASKGAVVAAEIFELDERDAPGRSVAKTGPATVNITPGGSATADLTAVVAAPKRWTAWNAGDGKPARYLARVSVSVDGKVTDTYERSFGFRTIGFTAAEGFKLNGRVVKLQGVCMHHDLGALGGAFNERAAERQLEILRGFGCNAIRTSHNPPAPQLLDLCDRMGFLVMDELLDCWKKGKRKHDYADLFDAWHERDLADLVRRDRNAPSVILWSTGNEVHEQRGKPEDIALSRHLTELFHREDPTRPVSCGFSGAVFDNGFADTVDVPGYNYRAILAKKPNYLDHLRVMPGKAFFGSETASTISSRGEYFFPVSEKKNGGLARNQVSSYDLYAPPWANKPDDDFDSADRLPALAGEFVWTGFDYLGEPTPYNRDKSNLLNAHTKAERKAIADSLDKIGDTVASRSSYFGIVDLAGFPKDRYYLYKSRWMPDVPTAHLLPHWNQAGREGEITPVHLYTSGDEAELFLNGRSLGRKKKGAREYRLVWNDVKYAPGELKAVAYRNGRPWAETVRRTTGEVATMRLAADRPQFLADGRDLSFVTVAMTDARGDTVPTANRLVKFSVTGPAEIAAVDNGDATSFLPFQGREMKSYNGLCLVVLRGKPGAPGDITLTAEAEGIPAARIRLQTQAR